MATTIPSLEGFVAAGFEPVREAFERNFTELGDLGASLCVYVNGEETVNLWGGVADPATTRPWTEDTLVLVFSATKGATATLAHLLAQRGELDLDAPIADYWPEFAAEGKSAVTTRMVLGHRAGLPALDLELSREQLLAEAPVVAALAGQRPAWDPGSAHGYHALTFGWLMGEVIGRATGRRLGDVLAEELAEPLGLDLFVGLPEAEETRVAALVAARPPDLSTIEDAELRDGAMALFAAMVDPESLTARALSMNGALTGPDESWNAPGMRRMQQPAANGITNARSLARMYAACIGEVDGVRLLSERTLGDATAELGFETDQILLSPSRYAGGYQLDCKLTPLMSESSFGHSGAGGALGFGDRAARVGFGYAQNQLGGGLGGDPRTRGPIQALRDVLATRA